MPILAAGEALTVTGVPTVAVELLAGAVRETEVTVAAVTVIVVEFTVLPSESITRALREKFPAAAGTHVTE